MSLARHRSGVRFGRMPEVFHAPGNFRRSSIFAVPPDGQPPEIAGEFPVGHFAGEGRKGMCSTA